MNEELVKIDSVEVQNFNGKVKYKIKANGKTFGLWQKKQDGSNTIAYDAFSQLDGMGIGQSVIFVYNEEDAIYDGNNFKKRTVIKIKKPDASQEHRVSGDVVEINLSKKSMKFFIDCANAIINGSWQTIPVNETKEGEVPDDDIPF